MTELIETDRGSSEPLRRRVVEWGDPAIPARAAAGLAGVEFLRAMVRGEFPKPPVAALLGMQIASVEPGRVVFEREVGEHLVRARQHHLSGLRRP